MPLHPLKAFMANFPARAQHSLHLASLALGVWLLGLTPALRAQQLVTNSLGMPLVHIPAGEFMMGSDEPVERMQQDYPELETRRFTDLTDEAPVHKVQISRGFFMGQHEVTVGEFARFVQASGYVPESIADGTGGYGFDESYDHSRAERADAFKGRDPAYSWRNPGFTQDDTHPVLNVSWHDAVALANWLSKKEGARYRLPTEAEWEYACRAGTATRYYNGDKPQDLAQIANTFDADAAPHWQRWHDKALNARDGYAFTAPVGSFKPNAFGLYDMLGNAWEWTADWYSEDYYAHSPLIDPQGPSTGSVRVRRGGSWHTWAIYARCSFRNWNTEQSRYPLLGIRLVKEE